jgi:Zn-dependent oligopeptidase
MRRFLTFGTYDFEVHSLNEKDLETLDIQKFFQQIKKEIMKLNPTKEECFPASFEHLVGGYDVGYYGYLMSEIYSVDMYVSVFKKDPLSVDAGLWYRKCILEPGCSEDAMDMLKKFLGRAPSIDAFLEEFGLKSSLIKPTAMDLSMESAEEVLKRR